MDPADPIDISIYKKFKLQVLSTKPNLPVLLKLEGPNGSTELLKITTNANVWEELDFDFTASPTVEYPRVTLLFDPFNGGQSENYTVYWDNLVQVDAPIINPENLSPFGTNLSSTLGVFSMDNKKKPTLLNSPQTEFLISENEYVNSLSKKVLSKQVSTDIMEIQPKFGNKIIINK